MDSDIEKYRNSIPNESLEILENSLETEDNRLAAIQTLRELRWFNTVWKQWKDRYKKALQLAKDSDSERLKTAARQTLENEEIND